MASNSEGRKVLKISSPPSSSLKLPPTPSQSPVPPPGFSMKFPLVHHRSSYLSPELALLYNQVFTALPQTPHFKPFADLSEETKEGIKLGCDIGFMNLVTKLRNFVGVVDPLTLLSEVESYNKQFKEFEGMGYDVTKLRERFNLLIRRAEQEKLLKDEVGKLEKEEKDREAEIESQEFVLMELATQYARIQKDTDMKRSEMQSISIKKRKIMEDSNKNLNEFRKLISQFPMVNVII